LLKDIVIAIQSYGKAHRFIKHHNLWKWIIVPGLVYMLLFIVSMYFFGKSATSVIEFITTKSGVKAWLDTIHSRVLGFLFTLGGMMLWLILMIFYFSLFKYVWLIVGSPLFAFLSEKTESILEGKEFPFSIAQLGKDIIRGIRIALRNTLWQSVYLFSFLIVSLIPVIGWITPVFAILLECYYYGFSMIDYSCERHKLTAAESILFISNRKGLAIGNGIVFYLMHLAPIIGWVLAPAYAVVAATLSINAVKQISNPTLLPVETGE
jgi:CysZ protein